MKMLDYISVCLCGVTHPYYMNERLYFSWKKYVKNLDQVLKQLEEHSLIAVGVAPYQRIIPALFMPRDNYQIYCVRYSRDIDVLRNYASIFCLEEKNPELADKVQATTYLVKNYQFLNYVRNRKVPAKLLFYQTNPAIVKALDEQKVPWVGNNPDIFDPILHKDGFRDVLQKLKLAHLPFWNMSVEDYRKQTYEQLLKRWRRPLVVQPGDYEVVGSTQFVKNQQDLEKAQAAYDLAKFQKVKQVKISPFIEGDSLSMLGCITHKGVLTSPLQLQHIDVPESLSGSESMGTFFGHDWGYRSWSTGAEMDAQITVEAIGKWLAKRGYKGIFGVDFVYDKKKDFLYPLECNPRFTGAIPVYSQVNLLNGVPPIDFFTVAEFLDIKIDFDFDAVNNAWKKPTNASHIAISPSGVSHMPIDMDAGIYSYNFTSKRLRYERPGAFLHELRRPDELIVIDQVLTPGTAVIQNAPRLFKFVIPHSIAEGSFSVTEHYRVLLQKVAAALKQGGYKPNVLKESSNSVPVGVSASNADVPATSESQDE